MRLIILRDAKPVEWLWLDRIPRGKLTLLDGDPGLGKTTLLLDVAARVSTGRPMPGLENGQRNLVGDVLYISAEDDEGDTLRPRLEAAGADLDRVHLWADAALPSLPDDVDRLAQLIVARDLALVVFDPIGPCLNGGLNTARDAEVRQALAPLRGVCELTGTAAVLVRHLNKDGKSSNALYRGGGSIAFIAAARSALLAGKDPDDETRRVFAHTKANLGPLSESLGYRLTPVAVPGAGDQVHVEWLGAVEHSAEDLLGVRQGRSENRDACDTWLPIRLNDGAVAFATLRAEAKERGWGERMLQRVAVELGVKMEREPKVAGGTLWSL